MKRIATILGLAACLAPAAWAASLDLTVTDVDTAEGAVRVAVFDSQQGWKGNTVIKAAEVDAETGSVTLTIDGLEPGEIGIKLYHDVDGDGDLDTRGFGIPTEPYGFSNDAPVRFGPPAWKKAKFALGDGANTHTIKLR
ncbi:MAG: DUF2141 domain-containing protein [Henriciella sp.]|uniref:DUF2141 domain-containing protein n=1 Tax=Henriciella sp. TaxID=1968823 RepID=UPI0032EE0352